MEAQRLSGSQYSRMILGGAAALEKQRARINDLNVFPVPDGDTGDNMLMTLRSGCAEIAESDDRSLSELSQKLSYGMLLGARGNSGVILSRIFAGIAKGFDGIRDAEIAQIARAMETGVEEAYHSVSVPVEGTILTVIRESVDYANRSVGETTTLSGYFTDLRNEMSRSVDRTPSLLSTLADAGVVDSGGAGLLVILDGMCEILGGGTVSAAGSEAPAGGVSAVDISKFTEESELEFGYCTEFLLRLQASMPGKSTFAEEDFTAFLRSHGESVVSFRQDTVVKVHVHTHTPGVILNEAQKYGEFLTLKIENMSLQHQETVARPAPAPKKPKKQYGIVAVASGDGLKELFSSLGVDAVVDGGQSMNPSSEDFLHAFQTVNANTIFVFPNNSNIVLTAKLASEMYADADVRVIPSKSIGDGFSAISMLDLNDESPDDIEQMAAEAMEGVKTGIVSTAIRDGSNGSVSYRTGDSVGFLKDEILASGSTRSEAALGLADALGAASYDVILLISGCDVPDCEAEELRVSLAKAYPKTEVILMQGKQPIYDYYLILQ